MPRLIVNVNVPLVDTDGVDHRVRKEVDVFGQLPPGVQTALGQLSTRLTQVLTAHYGANTVVEGMRYEP